MPRRSVTMAAISLALVLAGCGAQTPASTPPAAPTQAPTAAPLYRALRPQPLPVSPPQTSHVFLGFTAQATGYVSGEGVLVPVWPGTPHLADGLDLLDPQSGALRVITLVTPGAEGDEATASALGQGYAAWQEGPGEGTPKGPVTVLDLRANRKIPLSLPRDDQGGLATDLTFQGSYLDFVSTRQAWTSDVTSAVACRLPGGTCKDLVRRTSPKDAQIVIALAAAGGRVYVALMPQDPRVPGPGAILAVPQAGGAPHLLLRLHGFATSLAAGGQDLVFTEVVGLDTGLYLWRDGQLLRLTPPSTSGQAPEYPSYGDGYVTWWAVPGQPQLLDLVQDRLYTVPGTHPEIYGSSLTFNTKDGLTWMRLPPP